jgi:hypothetical protein
MDIYKQIAAEFEHDPEMCGSQAPQPRTPGYPFYKIINRFGASVPKEEAGFLLPEGPAQKIRAVILYTSDVRKFYRGDQIACQSFDGERPAPRVEAPPCEKVSTEQLVTLLTSFKGMDKTKVIDTSKRFLEEGRLSFCTMKLAHGKHIPLCPMSRYDGDRAQAGPCKPAILIYAYDVDLKRIFRLELRGSSIANYPKRHVSDYHKFRYWLSEIGGGQPIPQYAIINNFYARPTPDKKAWELGLDTAESGPIENAQNRAHMKDLAEQCKQEHLKYGAWVPAQKTPVAVSDYTSAIVEKPFSFDSK